ncbi:MAG TPA: RluA family pseudouridine synthase [Verrucomicrobiae bacterium]|nr:RluA family pseudouridine synthase [Verrucomicrobiae bacterium]
MVRTATPQVVFEDDHILVADKPGGMVCHSAQRPEYGSLAEWLREHGVATPRMINRLDRETSGLVVVAKNEAAAKSLGKAVLKREIEKEYLAICWGEFKEDRGVIDQPIAVSQTSAVYTKRVVDAAAGKPSCTEFAVEKRLRGFTVVRLTPRTGRAHQLRVHLSWLGHPIVGDKVYGPDETLYLQFIKDGVTNTMLDKLLLPRHALHAERVAFLHPRTRERAAFVAPLPNDMRTFIEERA